eukprot:4425260-Pyramimonas_sp.AAC.2
MTSATPCRSFSSLLADPVPSCVPRWLRRKRCKRDEEMRSNMVSIEQALLRTAYVDQVNEQKTRDWLPLRVYALYPHAIGSRS